MRASDYAARLREKQKAKPFYGLRERQFRSVCARAGGGGELLPFLELRLCPLPARVCRIPAWLFAEHDELWGRVEREPERHEIDAPIDDRLTVEFYSKSLRVTRRAHVTGVAMFGLRVCG